jgi:tRNA (adenine57-N1/adenine58-N1)-methyltransferase
VTPELIKENDLVYLMYDKRWKWLITVKKGENFHTNRGVIDHNDLINIPYGSSIFSKPYDSQGYKFFALKPLPSDYILHMSRKTQIIYPEDAGLILLYGGIGPGSKVIEAGCGSGALSCILGNYVQPNGFVYSFDVRESSLKRAKKNIQRARLSNYVSIQYGDIVNDDLKFQEIDTIVLDIPQPWEAVPKVTKYLKKSGIFISFSPTIEQVKKTTFALNDNDYIDVNTYELIKRTMQVRENATRPQVRMIGHTGYLTFGRKVQNLTNPYRERKPLYNEKISLNGMPLRS